ncbi:MAG: Uma2 family endonuclease, partial [Symploca sp. SIO2G7]|nr:Uma2 family endonuclease [Symploca sp. SIO2G7]
VYIYRPGVAVECLDNPATVVGESVLPEFVLNLSKIW